MLRMSRRDVVVGAGLATALGLIHRLAIVRPAHAQEPPDPSTGFYRYKVGSVEVTALYDGIWKKPHDPAFIERQHRRYQSSVGGGMTRVCANPLTVVVLMVQGS